MSTAERVSPVDVSVADRPTVGRAVAATTPGPVLGAWVAAATVLAAAVAVDPGGLRPFTSMRWFVVSVLVVVAATAVTRQAARSTTGLGLPRWFVGTGVVVVGSMAVSALFVGEPATAWFGHPQRHLGVLAWCVFGAAAIAGAGLVRTAGGTRILARAAVLAAVATGLASVADLAGWSTLGTTFAGGRIGGLLGQPTTLGAFAVLLLPVVAAAPVSIRVRILSAAGLVATLLGTQTRGALVGLGAAALVSLPALGPQLRRLHARWMLVVVVAAVVVLATPAGGRLLSSADSGRVDDWRLGAEVIADHPVLGVGPEGYRIAVIDALDAGYVDEHGRDVVIDRAHSAPLDVAAAGGVGAGLAYLVLVAGVAVATWRLQRRSPWSVPAAAGAGAVGFLVAGFLAFPTPEVDAVAWLFAGVAVAAASPMATRGRAGRGGRSVAALGAAALVAVTVTAGVTDVAADRWLDDARELSAAGRAEEAVAAADRATRLRPDLVDGWYVAAQVAAAGPTILDLDAGIDRATEGLRRAPGDPALRDLHASLVTERALRTELDRDRSEALRILDSLLADDPTNARARELRADVMGNSTP